MSYRAAIVLLKKDKIALIERHRAGLHYYTFPGGHVEAGEKPQKAAVREAKEELGLDVSVKRLLAEIWWHDKPQYYYLVEVAGGVFGTGTGEEMHGSHPAKGKYHPVWVPVDSLLDLPVLPRSFAQMVVNAHSDGWPEAVAVLHDEA
jgi:8-oxo-dGTP pyrophosphatase MutT (NUDIX family)